MFPSVEANTKLRGEGRENVRKRKREKYQKRKFWKKIEYIGFPLLSLFCAFIVMFIWLINGNDTNEAQTIEEAKNETESGSSLCPFWELTGDGYCDDETNIPECGYDYADCCHLENDRSLCTNCTCHLSEDEVQLFQNQSCIDPNHLITNHLGNGICDLNYNIDQYFFDVGDCCLQLQAYEKMTCKVEEDLVECPQYTCIPSNNFCIAEELGDGICQDHNNGPFCDYDLGDCCSTINQHLQLGNWGGHHKEHTSECCACFCHIVSHDQHIFYYG